MKKDDDERFTQLLYEKAAEAKREFGYHPKIFLGMLGSEGGFRTASKLLATPKFSDGFTELWLKKRLDLSVEAIVVESEWRQHFDNSLLIAAENKLRKADYVIRHYVPPLSGAKLFSGNPLMTSVPPQTGGELKKGAIAKQKNSISFSAHCERLGAPLANVADRWCGLSETNRRAVFTVWADRLQGGKYVFWKAGTQDSRIGAKELQSTIKTVMAKGYDAYGILCEAQDASATPRKRGYFQEETLLVLRFVSEAVDLVAYLAGEVAVADVLSGEGSSIAAFPSALDDLGAGPPGVGQPDRVTKLVTGYRRDDAVRRFVLHRAGGLCEHCGVLGFELPDKTRYLEAHHVIALADKGPDKVSNVIALCAHHHREAHYGRDAEALEGKFLQKLRQLAGS